jgi:8-oxo-dGTP pyrophosphatase MutT (NUDIX family)
MTVRPWKITESRYVVRDRWMTLRADRCETATGQVIEPYYVQEPEDWIAVVAFDDQDRILLNKQYRHGAGLVITELPSGMVDRGEDPALAASRELLEETGCKAEKWVALPVLSPNPARYANRFHGFMATGVHKVQEQQLDESEEIEFEFWEVGEVLGLIDAGGFLQSMHVAAVMMALRRRGMLSVTLGAAKS